MQTLKQELTRKLKYCVIKDNDEFDDSLDIYDIASDFPFANVAYNRTDDAFGIGMSGNHYDVCRVDVCLEYGNEIRDDKYIAKCCTLFGVVAVLIGMHIDVTPAKRAAYKHIKNSTYGAVDSILEGGGA